MDLDGTLERLNALSYAAIRGTLRRSCGRWFAGSTSVQGRKEPGKHI
jgi:hypothetical protein